MSDFKTVFRVKMLKLEVGFNRIRLKKQALKNKV